MPHSNINILELIWSLESFNKIMFKPKYVSLKMESNSKKEKNTYLENASIAKMDGSMQKSLPNLSSKKINQLHKINSIHLIKYLIKEII